MPSIELTKKEKSFTSKSNKPKREASKQLPAFDLSLIGALENDHEQILKLYNKVLDKALNKDLASLQLVLVEFATAFTNHIQLEDEKLYGYLKALASTKSTIEQKVVSEFSLEMKNISISIFSFLSQSPYIPVTENTIDGFIEEFTQMGSLLLDRINREEKHLYPIYKNSRKVVNIS